MRIYMEAEAAHRNYIDAINPYTTDGQQEAIAADTFNLQKHRKTHLQGDGNLDMDQVDDDTVSSAIDDP